MKYRKEFDSIGTIKVPDDKYWGASTQRSNKYFDIGDFLVRPIVIKSIAIIKKAAAIVHAKEKQISPKISKTIVKALTIVLEIFGEICFSLAWTIAAAFLIIAIDLITIGLTKKSPISKYLLDLCVDAPQYLSSGTLIVPMLSNSFLYFIDYMELFIY